MPKRCNCSLVNVSSYYPLVSHDGIGLCFDGGYNTGPGIYSGLSLLLLLLSFPPGNNKDNVNGPFFGQGQFQTALSCKASRQPF